MLAVLFLVIVCGFSVGANLLMMQSFQGIIDRDMHRFWFWMLLDKSYQDFHKQSVGEYLAWFTNDVSQIENLAWNPFLTVSVRRLP